MPRRRFFIPSERIRGNSALLSPDEARHLKTVLRLKTGDQVEVFDGAGRVYCGIVEVRSRDVAVARLEEIEAPGRSPSLILAAALIKPDRFEWILQKGTELGIAEFLPLQTAFSNVHIPGDRLADRLQRWRRIVRESAKQSRRPVVPVVHEPLSFRQMLDRSDFRVRARFLFWEKSSSPLTRTLPEADRTLLCVGPEGGWHSDEVAAAEQSGFGVFSLGPAILRAETAAVAAVAIFQFLMWNRGPRP